LVVLVFFIVALVMTVSGVALNAYGNPFGLMLVLLGVIPACLGSFTAGIIAGRDHSDGP
jgi:hypothetical protein